MAQPGPLPMNFNEYLDASSKKMFYDGFTVCENDSEVNEELEKQNVADASIKTKVAERLSKLGDVGLISFKYAAYPTDFTGCIVKFFERSMSLETANQFVTATYNFASDYAAATIKGPGNSRLFFPVLVSDKFDEDVLNLVENRDPIDNAYSFWSPAGNRYLHILFPILVELGLSTLTYYRKKKFVGRMYYSKMQGITKKYFEF